MSDEAAVKRRVSSSTNRHPSLNGPRSPMVWVKDSLPLLVLVGAAVVLFLVLRGGGGEDRRSFTFGPSINRETLPHVGGWDVTGVASPYGQVSSGLARKAERIAASDATLARLVRRGDGQQLGQVGPWRVGNDPRGGAVLAYKLRRAVAVDSDLPYVEIPPDGPSHGTCVTPYAPGWAHLRAPDVSKLSVLVDLRQERIVEISANAKRGRISPVAGKPYPTCNEDQPG